MPESPASDGSTEGQADGEDPVRRLAAALRDLWTSATEGQADDPQASAASPATFGVDQLSGLLRRFAGVAERVVGGRDDGHPGRSEFLGGMVLLGQAYLVATVSGLRFWRRVAQS